jgi:hypothetical protein
MPPLCFQDILDASEIQIAEDVVSLSLSQSDSILRNLLDVIFSRILFCSKYQPEDVQIQARLRARVAVGSRRALRTDRFLDRSTLDLEAY